MTDPFNGPGGPAGKGKKHNQRRLMIYAGAGLALVLLLVLARRQPAPASSDSAPQPTPNNTPISAPSDTGGGGSGGVVDNSGQLASFESALLDQLPATITSSIQAGIANGLPAPTGSASTDSPQTPSGNGSVSADFVGGVAAGLTAYPVIYAGTGHSGAQTGPGGSKAGSKAKTKPMPHPAAVKHPAAAKHPAAKHPAAAKHLPNKPTGRAHKKHG